MARDVAAGVQTSELTDPEQLYGFHARSLPHDPHRVDSRGNEWVR
jgi:hypothetical protein